MGDLSVIRSLDSAEARKSRGAFFTPPELADFVVAWAVRNAGDTVLEPSCGDAAFLLPVGQRLRLLGCPGDTRAQLRGVELHLDSATTASKRMADAGTPAHIEVGDFFEVPATPTATACVGNPPYVRYQAFSGPERARAQAAALSQGVRMSGLASSWAPFVVHAAAFLRPEGRLGLVLPAELLTTNYAASVRSFLLRRFAQVRLVLFDERVFPGVSEEVVLLLAEGEGPTDHFTVMQVSDLDDLAAVDREAASWHPTDERAKWSPALLPAGAGSTYQSIVDDGLFERLNDWGDTYLGAVTGNNNWFTLRHSDVDRLGIPMTELLAISPPGSKHLRGLTFGKSAWREMAGSGSRAWLFRPGDEPSPQARKYIEQGKKEGIASAYKCRVRSPWWRVPVVEPGHLLLTYMNHETPRLIRNSAGVTHLNSIHAVRLGPGRIQLGQDLLPIASLNTVTLLGAELVGRAYGGGLLKLEPREAGELPLPSPAALRAAAAGLRSLRPQLSTPLRGGKFLEAVEMVDRVLLIDGLGIDRRQLRALREARELMFSRRAARS